MRINVTLSSVSERGGSSTIAMECGVGDQVLRWFAFAACYRFANGKGEPVTRYVPQAVMLRGDTLDIDLVLRSVVNDGETLNVQYGKGPLAFQLSPNAQEMLPGSQRAGKVNNDAYIRELPLEPSVLADYYDKDVLSMKEEDFVSKDIVLARGKLLKYAGALQALFYYFNSNESAADLSIERMYLSQLRNGLMECDVVNEYFSHNRIDEAFRKSVPGWDDADAEMNMSQKTLSHSDFLVALVHLGGEKFAPGLEHSTYGYFELSSRLEHLYEDRLLPSAIEPRIVRRATYFKKAFNQNIDDLLSKARRFIQMTMYAMQEKRTFNEKQVLHVKALIRSLMSWEYVPEEISLRDVVLACLYAKNFPNTNASEWKCVSVPLELNPQELEICLTILGFLLYQKTDRVEAFPVFLGEFLDDIFHYARVIVEGSDSEESDVEDAAQGKANGGSASGGPGDEYDDETDSEDDG